MSALGVVARSYLYVPADRADLVAKALQSSADVVVLDLEDAIAPTAASKAAARAGAAAALVAGGSKPLFVRVNRVNGGEIHADLESLLPAAPAGIRLPKCESPDDVRGVAQRLARADRSIPLYCLLESAIGVERAYEIATCCDAVAGISLGEADLLGDLGSTADAALGYARSRCVMAARAAGLVQPVQSVFPRLRAEAELRASCQAGRELGFLGRSAIHPEQLGPINDAYTPSTEQLARARAVVGALDSARGAPAGSVLPDGAYVDEGVASSARRLIALAESLELEGAE